MFKQSLCSRRLSSLVVSLIVTLAICAITASAQTTAFTYQGRLTDGANPANGPFDMEFKLFDLATVGTGNQQGPTVTRLNVMVAAGTFSVQLDFGVCTLCFPGAKRYLEISLKAAGDPAYTTLSPRQQILSAPYSLKSANATAADSLSALCINCVTSSQIASVNGSAVTGTIPASSVPAGSDSYIQNTTTQQAASDFNISGNGVVGGTLGVGTSTPAGALHVKGASPVRILGDTSTLSGSEFVDFFARSSIFASDLGGMRIQRQAGSGDIDTLVFAAAAGNSASEKMRVTGNGNVGIGTNSPVGSLHVKGASPVRILGDAPLLAGSEYVDFMARSSALSSDLGGMRILRQTGTGNVDTLIFASPFGSSAREIMRVSGTGYVGIGTDSPLQRLHLDGSTSHLRLQSRNTNVWTQTEYVTDSREWHVGVGGSAVTNDINNKYYIGDATLGLVRLVVDTSGEVGIGTTSPDTLLHLRKDVSGGLGPRLTLMNGGGAAGAAVGIDFATYFPTGPQPSAQIRVTDDGNFSSYFRFFTKNSGNINNPSSERLTIAPNGNIGIDKTSPQAKLDVFGNAAFSGPVTIGGPLNIGGQLIVSDIPGGGDSPLCFQAPTFPHLIQYCSSSARYKSQILPLNAGLDLINRLRPVTFNWKASGRPDLGLIAEEVERVEPLLVTRNSKGEIEGVKYSQLSAVFINAFKEQHAQIESQQEQIRELQRQASVQQQEIKLHRKQLATEQQRNGQQQTQLADQHAEIEALKSLVCAGHPRAAACKAMRRVR